MKQKRMTLLLCQAKGATVDSCLKTLCPSPEDLRASQVALVVKNAPTNAEDVRDAGSILGLGRSPGVGPDNPLQYSCLENMNRGAWWTTVTGLQRFEQD